VGFDVLDLFSHGVAGVKVGEALAAPGELGFEDAVLVVSAGHDLQGRKAR
jgi:hypothetical protein